MKRTRQQYSRWFWLVLGSAAGCASDAASTPDMAQSRAGASAAISGSGGASGGGGSSGAAGGAAYALDASWCDVKRTLDTRCAVCHDEQHTAGSPMSLLNYAATQAPAVSDPSRKVYQLMGVRVHDTQNPMPPQQKLTAAELAAIDAWVAAGAPSAEDPTCGAAAPPVVSSPEQWPSHCDATYTILAHAANAETQPFSVPAGRELHPNLSLAAPWGSDALQAIAFRPIIDNPKILHHWILYGPQHQFLTGWAPGKDDTVLPSDVGMNLSGGTLTLNMHYNNTLGTQAEQDRSGVEICALKPANFRKHTAAVHSGFSALGFSIPAHATGFDVTGSCTASVSAPVTVFSASPHAHKLARHMKFSVVKASGEHIVMFDGSFSFDEQQAYPLNPMVQLETGDQVITTCTFDNTTDHVVRFGEDTADEMCFNFAAYYPMGALSCGFAL